MSTLGSTFIEAILRTKVPDRAGHPSRRRLFTFKFEQLPGFPCGYGTEERKKREKFNSKSA